MSLLLVGGGEPPDWKTLSLEKGLSSSFLPVVLALGVTALTRDAREAGLFATWPPSSFSSTSSFFRTTPLFPIDLLGVCSGGAVLYRVDLAVGGASSASSVRALVLRLVELFRDTDDGGGLTSTSSSSSTGPCAEATSSMPRLVRFTRAFALRSFLA